MAAPRSSRKPRRPDPLAGITPTPPTDQYVPVVSAGSRFFVAGHDPERGGRLVYHGRVGRSVSVEDTAAALRLATQNALASARDHAGSLERLRCVALVAFVSGDAHEGLDPRLLEESLAWLAMALPAGGPPAATLRPAQGLAGGMPVEVELVLEIRRPDARRSTQFSRARRPASAGARAAGPAHRRSAGRTS